MHQRQFGLTGSSSLRLLEHFFGRDCQHVGQCRKLLSLKAHGKVLQVQMHHAAIPAHQNLAGVTGCQIFVRTGLFSHRSFLKLNRKIQDTDSVSFPDLQ